MLVSVCLGAILIPKYLDFHSGYSAPRRIIAGIYSGIYSYSEITQTNAPPNYPNRCNENKRTCIKLFYISIYTVLDFIGHLDI